MVEGAPFGRPALFWGVVAVLDGCLLAAWACLGCRGVAGIVKSSIQGCQASSSLLYYMK
jgi:hypothetical protein